MFVREVAAATAPGSGNAKQNRLDMLRMVVSVQWPARESFSIAPARHVRCRCLADRNGECVTAGVTVSTDSGRHIRLQDIAATINPSPRHMGRTN
jgi:hypothetical protein